MKKEDFYLRLQEDLELDVPVDGDTDIANMEEWDSMATMVLIALVNEEFGISLSSNEIEKITTVASIVDIIGSDKFN